MSAPLHEAAAAVAARLRARGHRALFAGGCVRDQLLGKDPHDIDIVTDAEPDQVLEVFPRGNAVGAHFGVILVREGGHSFDVATFREDGLYRDGRRPDSVIFSTEKADARRRDFTVNGMFLDPENGEIIDHVGGRADLESGVLRAIGEPGDRIREDYLRMLRAVRFATALNFEIEEKTWAAIRQTAPRILEISPERIRTELDRIWLHENRVRGFDLLADSGLMKEILPELTALRGCEQPPQFHPEGDVYVHTRLMLGLLQPEASLPLVLSVLFHDIGKPATFSYDEEAGRIRFNGHAEVGAEMTRGILRRLKYSNEVTGATVAAVSHHMRFMDVQKMRTAKLKRFMARDTFPDELELHRVDCEGSNGFLDNYEFLLAKREEFASEPVIPPPLLNGHDLIERGWPRGPAMARVLHRAQDLQLEGTLTNREKALLWLDKQDPEEYRKAPGESSPPGKAPSPG